MSSSSVWVQLYYKGKDEPEGDPIQISPAPDTHVADLKGLVHPRKSKSLQHCDFDDLIVFPPKSFRDKKKYNPGRKLKEIVDELKDASPPTSDHHPLIVVAPAPKKQPSGDPGYPFHDSIYILYSKPHEHEIVVIATAFAVTKTAVLTAGHVISSKDETSGEIQLIDEPLFLTTVLVRNNGVISPEQGKVEIPVTVKKFHLENDWAVLKRSDGGVFPQTIPVSTSVADIPRDGASEPMTLYHVPVAVFWDDTDYTDRLHAIPKQGSVGLVKKNYIDFQNGGFDGSCGGPYVYRGKAIAIHTDSVNSALTAESLRIHQMQQRDRAESNKRMKVADEVTLADSCAESHTCVGSGMLICKRRGLVQYITASLWKEKLDQ